MSRRAADEAEILSVAVARAWRGRGLARRLLDLHLRRLAGLGLRAVFLEVDEDNVPARRLYARAGFREVGRRPGYYRAGPRQSAAALVLAAATLYNTRTPTTDGYAVVTDTKPNFIEAQCVAKGMRMTEQRRIIARVLADSADHPDVEELYRRCAEIDQHISISTVYRTVKLFEDAGII